MSAAIVQIADAVVAAINAHTFTAPFTASLGAVRLYRPDFKLTELATLQVVVVANSRASTLANRARTQEMGYDIDIGFLKKLQAPVDSVATQADIDDLLALVEEVGDFLMQMDGLTGLLAATPIALSNQPIYDSVALEDRAEFLSVLTVTFREYR